MQKLLVSTNALRRPRLTHPPVGGRNRGEMEDLVLDLYNSLADKTGNMTVDCFGLHSVKETRSKS